MASCMAFKKEACLQRVRERTIAACEPFALFPHVHELCMYYVRLYLCMCSHFQSLRLTNVAYCTVVYYVYGGVALV